MPQISTQEFERLPLRVHDFLAGVPLHDVWAIDLLRTRSGITLDEGLRTASACLLTPPPVVRALLNIRFFVGRLLGTNQKHNRHLIISCRNASRFRWRNTYEDSKGGI